MILLYEEPRQNLTNYRNVGQWPTWWSPCRIYVAPSVQRRKDWLTPTAGVPCSNAARTRKPLKFAWCQTRQQFSAVIGPKFTILRGHVEEILAFNHFLIILIHRLSMHALVAKIWPDKVARWCRDGDFLRPVFSASRVQQVSDLHPKFALRPHHVCLHPICDGWDQARKKEG